MSLEKNTAAKLFDTHAKPQGLKRIVLATKNSARALTWLFNK